MKQRNGGINLIKIGTYSFDEADLPETLYKYRDWTKQWHRTILTERIVYMAAPSSFEDPLDCKNPVRWDLLRRKDIFSRYLLEIEKQRPDWPKKRKRSWATIWLKKSPLRDKDFIKEQAEQTLKDFDCRFGVLSLTANPDNPMMWETYANASSGFCVGFDPKILFRYLGGGGEVHYTEELPKIYPTPRHSYEAQHILQVFYKEKKWEYEQEYRTHKFSPIPMSVTDRQIIIPPEAYKEIIIGKNMPEATKEDLLKSLPDELQKLSIIYQK